MIMGYEWQAWAVLILAGLAVLALIAVVYWLALQMTHHPEFDDKDKDRLRCPKCGNTDGIFTTCMGIIAVGKPARDTNWASCPCGHKDRAWKFGAPDIEPIKGTENMTDKEIENFWNTPPTKLKGRGVYNPAGIQQVKFDIEKNRIDLKGPWHPSSRNEAEEREWRLNHPGTLKIEYLTLAEIKERYPDHPGIPPLEAMTFNSEEYDKSQNME